MARRGYSAGTKIRQTGDGTLTIFPTLVSFPVLLSIEYSTMLPVS